MTKNMYYRTVFKRTNTIKEITLSFFIVFCSWPRLLLEVFIRKNFGERYYSFSGAMTILVILAFLPLYFIDSAGRLHGSGIMGFLRYFLSWYIFLVGFFLMAVQRRKEIKLLPSVYDFARFSLSTGNIHHQFYETNFMGKPANVRTIETVLEPGFFLIIGIIHWMFGQPLGLLLVICSIFYSLSYRAAYYQGDQFVMDKIDEMICNEELVNAFLEGRTSDETRGFNFYGHRPADPEVRRRVADTFIEDEIVVAM
ncbi:hypothetical protein GO755_30790 [Spirosoma sp. HMF4905]|uniref:Uncharacterized protein n=1 Tax=Spirosoma arboris TaxID=2682092 RepID=A0A7K1SL21_9BACT|nr:hypothetical protein [Spirosoma arboris]MVM34458.1 hypothetical protein [Spirosoma arboris]